MNPPDFRGLENFEVVIFLGPSFCEILGGGGGGGGWGGGGGGGGGGG